MDRPFLFQDITILYSLHDVHFFLHTSPGMLNLCVLQVLIRPAKE